MMIEIISVMKISDRNGNSFKSIFIMYMDTRITRTITSLLLLRLIRFL